MILAPHGPLAAEEMHRLTWIFLRTVGEICTHRGGRRVARDDRCLDWNRDIATSEKRNAGGADGSAGRRSARRR
jgi:hypothetical protein